MSTVVLAPKAAATSTDDEQRAICVPNGSVYIPDFILRGSAWKDIDAAHGWHPSLRRHSAEEACTEKMKTVSAQKRLHRAPFWVLRWADPGSVQSDSETIACEKCDYRGQGEIARAHPFFCGQFLVLTASSSTIENSIHLAIELLQCESYQKDAVPYADIQPCALHIPAGHLPGEACSTVMFSGSISQVVRFLVQKGIARAPVTNCMAAQMHDAGLRFQTWNSQMTDVFLSQQPDGGTGFSDLLPDDILVVIFSLLSGSKLVLDDCSIICHRWHQLVTFARSRFINDAVSAYLQMRSLKRLEIQGNIKPQTLFLGATLCPDSQTSSFATFAKLLYGELKRGTRTSLRAAAEGRAEVGFPVLVRTMDARSTGFERAAACMMISVSCRHNLLPHKNVAYSQGWARQLFPVLGNVEAFWAVSELCIPSLHSHFHCTPDLLAMPRRQHTAYACRVGLGIAYGLEHVHLNGLVHGDLRLATIWFKILDGGRVPVEIEPKIADFSVTRPATRGSDNPDVGVPLPPRSAPELSLSPNWSCNVSQSTDRYSLGVVLYDLLRGSIPTALNSAAAARASFSLSPAELFGEEKNVGENACYVHSELNSVIAGLVQPNDSRSTITNTIRDLEAVLKRVAL